MTDNEPRQSDPGKEQQRLNDEPLLDRLNKSWWRILVWVFLFMLIFYFVFEWPPRENLTYTEFIANVKKGNIASVVFRDHQIRGRYTEAFLNSDQAEGRTEQFLTHIPVIEEAGLLELLQKNNVKIDARQTDQFPWGLLLVLTLPWLILIGYMVYAGRKVQKQMGGGGGLGLFNVGRSRARKFKEKKVDVHFDDVAGLENAKKDLREIVDYLKKPEKFFALGAEIPKGILLKGPPGCGKTLLARAMAGEVGVPFYQISGSEFIEMFVGVGASRVRDMFKNAKKQAPSIIFIDEIDSIGRSRGTGVGGGHDEREQTLNQILSEMDGFDPHESVVVIAATNRPDVLDPALTRPGRFDRQINLPLPDKNARHQIYDIHARNVPLADDVDLENLAARTVGFSGADIKNLVNEAALLAGRNNKNRVHEEDFEKARDKIMLGMQREDLLEDQERELISYHESGHALVAHLMPNTDPLQKVTIIPRGRSLGATEQVPEIDRHNLTRSYLLGIIAVRLAGRVAEKLAFDELSNGAADDLKQLTRMTRRMVCQWGMSENLGPMTFNQAEEHVFLGQEMTRQKEYSEETARDIDEEVRKILLEQEQRVTELLENNRDRLDRLAAALLEHETLDKDQIIEIIGT